jgi:SAM-dependent methyltransferase
MECPVPRPGDGAFCREAPYTRARSVPLLKLRPDWQTYLHALRRREIEIIFRRCPPHCFARGLELGAGDGFQSGLLARYAATLVVTDYYPGILAQPDTATIMHRVCDAEQVGDTFAADEFDLSFSSNMLEHLPQPQQALAGLRRVLRDDGIAVHVMPSPFWKLCQMIGFYPNFILARLERYSARRTAPRRDAGGAGSTAGQSGPAGGWDNNPKVDGRRYSYLRRLLWATPHGAARGNLEEFRAFRQAHWREQFSAAGFTVAHVLPGPVSSGYGFGLDRTRTLLERCGLASEYVYVTHKAGRASPYLAYFG